MYYVTSSYLATPNPQQTALFLQQVLDFKRVEDACDMIVANGSVGLYLVQGKAKQAAHLLLQCTDIYADAARLLDMDSIHALTDIQEESSSLTQQLYCDCGLVLHLVKRLSEDEQGVLLPLLTALPWQSEVKTKAQHILRITPLGFREQARVKMVEHAEYQAVSAGELEVAESDVMRAFVSITPAFQHRALFEAMVVEGVDAALYIDLSQLDSEGI